ncbi:MAG: transcriptional regulator [Chloroflexi bacterium B3_Chlor]|nr:MAG: transcriptional regulator [Chloroflexi bacterium B3_Chlor]
MSKIHSQKYQEFLKRLRNARKEAGMTQAEVAAVLGKPQSFISKCETGERRVDIVELSEFARLYSKTLDFFLT